MRFKIKNGQAAVYDPEPYGDAPLTNPRDHMDLLKWHNELEHIGIVEIRDYTVNLPATTGNPWTNTYVLDTHDQPAEPFVYGYITTEGGAKRPFSPHAFVDRLSDPIQGDPNGYPRHVSLGIDGANIVLHGWARRTWIEIFPATTIGVRVFITDLSLTELANPTPPAPNRLFRWNEDEVLLGPFDASKRWLRANVGTAQFPLINGMTMDAFNNRRWRYRIPDGSAFAYTTTIGSDPPAVDTATFEDVDA